MTRRVMMSNANEAIAYLLNNEGGWEDLDEPTNFGITLNFYRQYVKPEATAATLQAISQQDASNIYNDLIWIKYNLAKIENQHLANYVLDMIVNHGDFQAIQLVQRALWAALKRMSPKDDGILGQITLDEINNAPPSLIFCLIATRAAFYRQVVFIHPDSQRYLQGWLKRAYELT